MKKILAIGAYERDNFGDILFLLILQKFFQNRAEVIPASIIFSDMRSISGMIVIPYSVALLEQRWDAVWVVGGEIGGLELNGALSMDIESYEDFAAQLHDDERKMFFDALNCEFVPGNLAYLPDIRNYERNKMTPMVINSVGFSNIRKMPNYMVRTIIEKLTISDVSISVRDRASENFLNNNGIGSILAPDMVHSVSHFFPKLKRQAGDYFIFQANEDVINQYGVEFIARTLSQLSTTYSTNIVLLAAGTARKHDSIPNYFSIVHEFKSVNSFSEISIFSERSPLKIIECIASSSFLIGTSLHSRIVSESYHIPVISLKNEKVTNYLDTWNTLYPYNVGIEDLIETVDLMLNIHPDFYEKSLQELALKNLKFLASSVLEQEESISQEGSPQPYNFLIPQINNSNKSLIKIVRRLAEKNTAIKAGIGEYDKLLKQKEDIVSELQNVNNLAQERQSENLLLKTSFEEKESENLLLRTRLEKKENENLLLKTKLEEIENSLSFRIGSFPGKVIRNMKSKNN